MDSSLQANTPATPKGVEPDELKTPAPEPVADDPLDSILRQIVGGYFVLTDGQGSVSKWSEPAELLFGKEAPEALGHSFFDGLLAGPLSDDAEQWRRFLAAGPPGPPIASASTGPFWSCSATRTTR